MNPMGGQMPDFGGQPGGLANPMLGMNPMQEQTQNQMQGGSPMQGMNGQMQGMNPMQAQMMGLNPMQAQMMQGMNPMQAQMMGMMPNTGDRMQPIQVPGGMLVPMVVDDDNSKNKKRKRKAKTDDDSDDDDDNDDDDNPKKRRRKQAAKPDWEEDQPHTRVRIRPDTYVRPWPGNRTNWEHREQVQGRRMIDVLDFLEDNKYIYGMKISKGWRKTETLLPKQRYTIHATVQVVRYARHLFLKEKDPKAKRRVQLCSDEGDGYYARFDYNNGAVVKVLCDDGEDELGTGPWKEVADSRKERRKAKLEEESIK